MKLVEKQNDFINYLLNSMRAELKDIERAREDFNRAYKRHGAHSIVTQVAAERLQLLYIKLNVTSLIYVIDQKVEQFKAA